MLALCHPHPASPIDTEAFLVDDTQFWVVRARISGATVSGLGTLISGSYLGMQIGHSKTKRRAFTALKEPPVVAVDVPGRYFVLKTDDLGIARERHADLLLASRGGRVTQYALDPDGKGFTVTAFVNAPYDRFVTGDSRFWHASGVDVSLTASGLTVQTQSLLSILVGGIAFETPPNDPPAPPAEPNAVFTLFAPLPVPSQAGERNPRLQVRICS